MQNLIDSLATLLAAFPIRPQVLPPVPFLCPEPTLPRTVFMLPDPACPPFLRDHKVCNPVAGSRLNSLEHGVLLADTQQVDMLASYRRDAMKLAVVTELGGDEGFAARIPGFRGLVATGQTRKDAIVELGDALADWVQLALRRGIGLPPVKQPDARALTAA